MLRVKQCSFTMETKDLAEEEMEQYIQHRIFMKLSTARIEGPSEASEATWKEKQTEAAQFHSVVCSLAMQHHKPPVNTRNRRSL